MSTQFLGELGLGITKYKEVYGVEVRALKTGFVFKRVKAITFK